LELSQVNDVRAGKLPIVSSFKCFFALQARELTAKNLIRYNPVIRAPRALLIN